MRTNRSETRQISIDAPPDDVLEIVGDARTLPRWAPNFAATVEPRGDHWLVNGDTEIDLLVDRARGTADIVSARDPQRGAFTRVIPNGAGSEYLFTLFFPDGTDEAAVIAQMAVVEEELRTVRTLAEPAAHG